MASKSTFTHCRIPQVSKQGQTSQNRYLTLNQTPHAFIVFYTLRLTTLFYSFARQTHIHHLF